jgi:hypothetical protein
MKEEFQEGKIRTGERGEALSSMHGFCPNLSDP